MNQQAEAVLRSINSGTPLQQTAVLRSRTLRPARATPHRRPAAKQGMYDPAQEHDACGVGFVVNIRGEKSHQIVRSGLEILVNLTHRGACGCDPLTGDGAGILTQMPHEFFAAKAAEAGFELPAAGRVRHRHHLSAANRTTNASGARSGSKRSRPTKGKSCSAGATCRSTTTCWDARPATSNRSSGRSSSAAASRPRPTCSSGNCTSFASGSRSTSAPASWSRSSTVTSPACRRGSSSTKGCCWPIRSNGSITIWPTSGSFRPWRWSISATAPTPSRRGTWRIRSASWPTTAKSTRSRATSTGCTPAKACWPIRSTAPTSRRFARSACAGPATRRSSTTRWSCWS